MRTYTYNWQKYLLSLVLLFIGCMIYLLYRPKSILLFDLIEIIGLMEYVDKMREYAKGYILPDIVINCIPAGLWTASYLIKMYCKTEQLRKKHRLLISLPLPLAAIILEFFQLWGWCPGTFDIYDLICYVTPIVLFIILI